MRIIARSTLVAFWEKNPRAKPSLERWHQVTKSACWGSTSDVQAAFTNAKVLNGERVRFEVSGGDFRLIVAFDFERGVAFVKFIGTHSEYDRIDALTVSLF